MPYSAQSDILEQLDESRLIQLTDDNDLGTVDADVVTRAISDADAEIDGYCGTRYTVPFTTVPDIIRKFSVDIAIYNLYARRQGAPEDRKYRYEAALRFLRDIAKGVASLGEEAPAEPGNSGPAATTSKSDRIFTRGRSSDGSSGSLDNF